ncbi:MAG: DNA polymerase III subunit gamma/tau, partial [Rhodobacteraceae bacterium]|nr:DNA polymerase III subunit gamma/tau [Paracoccaceae bacterium]
EVAHWLSVIKVTPAAAEDPTVGPDERDRGRDLAGRVSIRVLARMWQMLLKALEEVAIAPNAMMAAEMAVIRLTHVADLPSPEDLVRQLQATPPATGAAPRTTGGGTRGAAPDRAMSAAVAPPASPGPRGGGGAVALAAEAVPADVPATLEAIVALIREKRDMVLLTEVEMHVRPVRVTPGRIEFEPAPGASADLAARLAQRLGLWTGQRWGVSVVAGGGQPSLAARQAEAQAQAHATASANPLVRAVLDAFPGARVHAVRPLAAALTAPPTDATGPGSPSALAEGGVVAAVPDAWDPFEDD